MVEGDDYDVSAFGETDSIVDGAVAAAAGVGSAVDVDQHGTALAVAEAGGPDVEVEAVFAVGGVFFVEGREGGAAGAGVDGLRGLGAEGEGVSYAGPGDGFGGGLESGFGGVVAVGDALEDVDSTVEIAFPEVVVAVGEIWAQVVRGAIAARVESWSISRRVMFME